MKRVFRVLLIVVTAGFVGCGPTDKGEKGAKDSGKGSSANAKPSDAKPKNSESNGTKKPEAKDIVDTAVAAGDFGTLAAALKAADLVETLKSDGPFTVFAPTDAAFAKLPAGTVENLLKPENKEQLVGILTYHVVSGKVDSKAVAGLKTAKTVNGAEIAINTDDGVKINEATVTTADIACSNGIIHVIDAVILPPAKKPASTSTSEHSGEPLEIEGVGSFKTVFAAIEAAGLKKTLADGAPFTILAPTDKAFAALPEGTVENLLKPENKEKLASILTYHVIAGKVESGQVVKMKSAKTVNGAEVNIKVEDGTVHINDAKVLKADVPCEVGIIHAIDKVLMPK